MNLPELSRRFTSLLAALCLFAAVTPALAPEASQQVREKQGKGQTATRAPVTATKHPFLWSIDGRGDRDFKVKSWLYGTMHLGDKRLITLPKVVNDARESADALYCELDMALLARSQLKMTKMMLLPKGQQLSDQLPPELYERLKKYMRKHGSSITRLKKMKVWAANLTLATIDIMKEGFIHSLDDMIYKEARSDGLEVGGLETLDEQMNAFTSGPPSDHVLALGQALDIGEEYDAQGRSAMTEMLEAYLSGECAQLVAKLKESSDRDPELAARMMKPLLDDRNVRMADRMSAKLVAHPDKSYFFAVGAMHYPGKMGVLELMRAKGYRITRINPPPPSKLADLAAQVEALERRIEKMMEIMTRTSKEKARLQVRVRKLEFQVKVLEKRLR